MSGFSLSTQCLSPQIVANSFDQNTYKLIFLNQAFLTNASQKKGSRVAYD